MQWGVACMTARITTRTDVYATMVGSLTDDQVRQSPDYTDEANVQPAVKILAPISYHAQSPGPAAPGSNAHIVIAREPFIIPTPATTVQPVPNLNVSQSCCCVRVRGVCHFSCFLLYIAPGGQKPRFFFRKRPGHSKRARASFYTCKIIAPQGRLLAL